ncbi:hypothetical protein [Weissella soli]|uniref:hypothetical protein n=1 Tax=Weissella soli TaxID=155866 RepID=UPI0011BB8FF3|nr:hypothetical protein [Weissella soli]MCT8394883.1 hypothetical protein [Weissella soli]QEA34827.1 hypothetical protein FGL88_03260 [Weissella soli]GJM47820.1 hypothetical protein WSSLDB02_03770 [Weissella soli]
MTYAEFLLATKGMPDTYLLAVAVSKKRVTSITEVTLNDTDIILVTGTQHQPLQLGEFSRLGLHDTAKLTLASGKPVFGYRVAAENLILG